MPPREDRPDDTIGRSELELIKSEAARAADIPLIDKVSNMVEYMRTQREENHWVNRSREAFRSGRHVG